jgi:hypothetical protein
MTCKHDPEKVQRILEELDKLLEQTSPPRNKKQYRAVLKAQMDADQFSPGPNSLFARRVFAHLDRLSFDLKKTPSQVEPPMKPRKQRSVRARLRAWPLKEGS